MPAGRRENMNETQAIAPYIIVPGRVLLRIGDEKCSADVLNVKWRKTTRDAFGTALVALVVAIAVGIEGVFIQVNALEVRVIDFHFAGTEVRDVEESLRIYLAGSHAFVNRSIGRAIVGIVHLEDSVLATIPAGDGSIFGAKHENCRFAVRKDEIGAAIEDHSGRSGLGSGSCVFRRRDRNGSSPIDGDDLARAAIERGGAGVIVGDPPRAASGGAS